MSFSRSTTNNDNLIKVSWLCAIYKKTKFKEFKLAINSIICQKGNYKQEIIIVQDGNLNREFKNLRSFLKTKNKLIPINYLKLNNNKGLGIALYEGCKRCKGDFIARFDTDDINCEDRLIKQIPILEKNLSIAVVGSWVGEFHSSNDLFLELMLKKAPPRHLIKRRMNFFNPINHPSAVIRREAISKSGYNDMPSYEDYYLWLRLRKNGWGFENIQEITVFMKVDNFFEKRWGLKYAVNEFNFLIKITKENLINKFLIPIFLLRIFSRILISRKFQKFLRSFKNKTIHKNPIYLFNLD